MSRIVPSWARWILTLLIVVCISSLIAFLHEKPDTLFGAAGRAQAQPPEKKPLQAPATYNLDGILKQVQAAGHASE